MKFKIDENSPAEFADILREHDYEASTVAEQGLKGHRDQSIAQVCREEDRVLITCDKDFADIRAYPPSQYPGMIVLRLANQEKWAMLKVFRGLVPLLRDEPLSHHLWIVEETRVPIRGSA